MDPDKSNFAKEYIVETAIRDAAFILEKIDKRWPAERNLSGRRHYSAAAFPFHFVLGLRVGSRLPLHVRW